jgi:hypothetical protein
MASLKVILPDMLATTAPQAAIGISTSASPVDHVISMPEQGLREQASLTGHKPAFPLFISISSSSLLLSHGSWLVYPIRKMIDL